MAALLADDERAISIALIEGEAVASADGTVEFDPQKSETS